MSVHAIAWALDVEGLKAGPKLTLLVLANYADENNICWPSAKAVCRQSGQSVAAMRRSLRILEKAGLLQCEARRRQDGSFTSQRYRLVIDHRSKRPAVNLRGYPVESAGHEPSIEPRGLFKEKRTSLSEGTTRTTTAKVVPIR